MQTSIWINSGYQKIDPDTPVRSLRNLRSFCAENLLPQSIVKSQGGYYNIKSDGTMFKVFRTLGEVSYSDIYDILK